MADVRPVRGHLVHVRTYALSASIDGFHVYHNYGTLHGLNIYHNYGTLDACYIHHNYGTVCLQVCGSVRPQHLRGYSEVGKRVNAASATTRVASFLYVDDI